MRYSLLLYIPLHLNFANFMYSQRREYIANCSCKICSNIGALSVLYVLHIRSITEAEFMNVRTILLRFLSIILRDLRFEVSVWIHWTIGNGYGFLSGFPPFSFTVCCTVKIVRGCVSLKKLKTQGKAVEVTVYSKKENSSKNLASKGAAQLRTICPVGTAHWRNFCTEGASQ
jgi:hypothetical protein